MIPRRFDPDSHIEPLREPVVMGGAARPWRRVVRGWPKRWRALVVRRAFELSRTRPFFLAEKIAFEEVAGLISEHEQREMRR